MAHHAQGQSPPRSVSAHLHSTSKPTVNTPHNSNGRRAGILLGLSNLLDMMAQFALPILLTRLFSADDFGAYRSLWLLAGTAAAVAPWGIPASLYYFLPRSTSQQRALHIRNAITAMGVISIVLLCAIVALTATGLIPFHDPALFSIFASLWVFSTLLDTLCSAMGRIDAQAKTNLAFSLIRVTLIAGTALISNSIEHVLFAHVLLGAIRAAATVAIAKTLTAKGTDPTGQDGQNNPRLRDLVSYTLPFGASAALYGLRSKADQWIVIAQFGQATYGVYSLGAFFSPIQGVIRATANAIALPAINRMHGQNGQASAGQLNKTTNIAVAAIMFPSLSYMLANASSIIDVIFGAKYAAATPVLQIFTCTLLVECIEVTTLLIANRQGRFLMMVDALSLLIAIASAYVGMIALGPTGAAIGALAASSVAQVALFTRLASITGEHIEQLQEWQHLRNIALSSAFAAGTAQVATLLTDHPPLFLLASSAIHAIAYVTAIKFTDTRHAFKNILGERISRIFTI